MAEPLSAAKGRKKRARTKVPCNRGLDDHPGGELRIDLHAAGMTALHRVGLAGLWLTLKAIEDDVPSSRVLAKAGGSWELKSKSVTLRWTGSPDKFFESLFRESFRIDKNGLIWLPAAGEPTADLQRSVVLQNALLGSFLQHGRTRTADPAQKPGGAVSVDIDGGSLAVRFRRVTKYAHQEACFKATGVNSLKGWLFPGGSVRHVGLGESSTALAEPAGRALCLRYAPAGILYFEIRRRGSGVRPRYALVLPELNDLPTYARARASFMKRGVKSSFAAGTTDAGYRTVAMLHGSRIMKDTGSMGCRVVSFGTVPWSSQQKTRVGISVVEVRSAAELRVFSMSCSVLQVNLIRKENREPFWDVPQVPDLVAENLACARPWWAGFSDFVADSERRAHVFHYEKGGLSKMVQSKEALPLGPERTFVLTCHEAWRRRLGQLGERARREGTPFRELARREFERLRVAFSRCKNAATLRETVTDFWARSGSSLRELQDGWREVLTLMDEQNWRKGRDLALLALASYRPATKEEKEAIAPESTVDDEEEESK